MPESGDKCKPESSSALQTYLADFETKFEFIKEKAMCIKAGGKEKLDEVGVEVKKSFTVIKESTSKSMVGIRDDFKVACDGAKLKMNESWEVTKVEMGKIGGVIKDKTLELFDDPKK